MRKWDEFGLCVCALLEKSFIHMQCYLNEHSFFMSHRRVYVKFIKVYMSGFSWILMVIKSFHSTFINVYAERIHFFAWKLIVRLIRDDISTFFPHPKSKNNKNIKSTYLVIAAWKTSLIEHLNMFNCAFTGHIKLFICTQNNNLSSSTKFYLQFQCSLIYVKCIIQNNRFKYSLQGFSIWIMQIRFRISHT